MDQDRVALAFWILVIWWKGLNSGGVGIKIWILNQPVMQSEMGSYIDMWPSKWLYFEILRKFTREWQGCTQSSSARLMSRMDWKTQMAGTNVSQPEAGETSDEDHILQLQLISWSLCEGGCEKINANHKECQEPNVPVKSFCGAKQGRVCLNLERC
jgi:hypothetical protein